MTAEGSSENWSVCTCNICSGQLEFDAPKVGATIQCPHCGVDTVLFIPNFRLHRSLKALRVQAAVLPERVEAVEQTAFKPAKQSRGVITTTGNDVAGHTIESYLGLVRGIVVRSPNIVQGMLGGLKQIVGGNIESFAEVCEAARMQAFYRMVEHAREMGANAIIAMRYDATEFAPGVTEVLAYGTAVKLAER